MQAVAHPSLFGDELVTVVDKQLEVAVHRCTGCRRQALLATHDASNGQSVVRVALARAAAVTSLAVGHDGRHLAHIFAGFAQQPRQAGTEAARTLKTHSCWSATACHNPCSEARQAARPELTGIGALSAASLCAGRIQAAPVWRLCGVEWAVQRS